MADGKIKIDIEIDGKEIKTVISDIKQLEKFSKLGAKGIDDVKKAAKEVDGKKIKETATDVDTLKKSTDKGAKGVDGMADALGKVNPKPLEETNEQTEEFTEKSQKATKSTKSFVIALAAVKVAGMAFNALKNAMDGAISRFDTFQRFPKVMEALGFGAEESEHAINKLSNAIDGLPTTLDDIVSSTQKFVGINGSLSRSTDIAEGLNNAFLASGSSSADAARGAEQYAQMLQNGTVDMQSWRSINETMGLSLNYVAKEMLGTEASSMDLYSAIKGGSIAFRDFEDALIDAGTGTGELAKLARENSKGLATSIGNLKNATVKGLANVLESIDKVVKKVSGKNIAENLDSLKKVVNNTFKFVEKTIETSIPLIVLLSDSFKILAKVGKELSPVLIGVGTAFAAYKVITTVSDSMKKYNQMSELAIASGKALTLSTKAKTTATILDTGATEAQAIAEAANNGTLVIGAAIVDVFTGKIKATVLAKAAWTTATTVLSGALTFLTTNPIGMTIAAIGVLVGASAALVKWFGKESKASEELSTKIEEQKAEVDSLVSSITDSANARKEEAVYTQEQTKYHKANASAITELASKERLSTKEKREMLDMIDMLNSQYGDLNIQYDENTGKLNTNNESLQTRIDLYAAHDKALKAEEDLNLVKAEGNELDKQLIEIAKQKEEVYETAGVNRRELNKKLKELEEQENALIEAQSVNSEEYKRLQIEKTAAYEAYASAEQELMKEQVDVLTLMSETQMNTVESMKATWQSYADSATNMFDTLSDKQTLSVEEMQANLEENQRVIGQWGENIAALAERGVDEGLLNTLREAGPSSAGYVAALVEASDAELNGLNTSFKEGGDTATQALKDAFGLGAQEIPQEVMGLVTATKDTLMSEIEAADFKSLGKNIPEGTAQGIKDGANEVGEASKALGLRADEEFKSQLGIQSPSRVFKESGGYIIDGLVIGLTGGTGKVTGAMNKLKNVMVNALRSIETTSNASFKNYSQNMSSSLTQASSIAIARTNQMKTTFTSFNSFLRTNSTTSMTAYTQAMTNGLNRANQIVTSGNTRMRAQFTSLRTSITTLSSAMMSSYASNMQNGSNRATSAIVSGNNRMISALYSLRSGFYSAGVNASYGLASGINAGSSAAIYAAQSLASRVSATMKNALKIHSPSRVMRDKIGRYIPQGIAKGIEEDSKFVDNALNKLVQMPKLSAEKALGAFGGTSIDLGQSVSNTNVTKTINNQPLVTMQVVWKGKEDIRRTMEKMGYIVNVDERGLSGA